MSRQDYILLNCSYKWKKVLICTEKQYVNLLKAIKIKMSMYI